MFVERKEEREREEEKLSIRVVNEKVFNMTQFLRIWFTIKYVTKCNVKINIFIDQGPEICLMLIFIRGKFLFDGEKWESKK